MLSLHHTARWMAWKKWYCCNGLGLLQLTWIHMQKHFHIEDRSSSWSHDYVSSLDWDTWCAQNGKGTGHRCIQPDDKAAPPVMEFRLNCVKMISKVEQNCVTPRLFYSIKCISALNRSVLIVQYGSSQFNCMNWNGSKFEPFLSHTLFI
jgi:hypothetical protein